MMTDGTEERQFLYAEDCCEALETVMERFTDFKPEDPLHITSFRADTNQRSCRHHYGMLQSGLVSKM